MGKLGCREQAAGMNRDMGYNSNGISGADATRAVICPYCGSANTEFFSLFGQQLLTVQYYCNGCRTPFEYVKDDAVLDDYLARKEGQQ